MAPPANRGRTVKTIDERLPDADGLKTRKGAEDRIARVLEKIGNRDDMRGSISLVHQRADGLFVPVVYLTEPAKRYALHFASVGVCVIG